MADGKRYYNLGWFGQHPFMYELGGKLLSSLRRRAAAAVGSDPKKKVLDIACGSGINSYELAKLGHAVTGIDLDQDMLEVARKKISPACLVSFVHGDASNLMFNKNSFDSVTISFAMHDVPYGIGVRILKESRRVLTSDGEITITDYNEPNKNLMSRLLYRIARLYESPNYARYIKTGLDQYLREANLTAIRRITLLGCVQIVSCK